MLYQISGIVIKGDQYGRKIGFPTVNLELDDTEEFPPCGVYSGEAILDNKVYRAGIAINQNKKVDAHLIGYDADAYGKKITLKLEKFLREYKNFESEEELKKQIAEDLKKC